MSNNPRVTCAACSHDIDASAKVCPYCGADPQTGQKVVDTDALLREEFKPRHVTKSESVFDFARQRQGVVIAFAVAAGLLLLLGLHQFATWRNEAIVNNANAVPLAEVTDITEPDAQQAAQQMPELKFQFDGHPQTMRTFIVEPGAVTPPEVVAAQQAAAAAAQPKPAQPGAAPQPAQPQAAPPPPARPPAH